ncbi:MAG: DUF3644 domain-containing protein [Chitinophagaceae bacterium]|nr:DUF3644 domain-containing protein [Chitinophagaceae bacterium]
MRGETYIVKQLLQKAKDSALLGIEFYNKPAVRFKSEGFIAMMIIAWTSLFHAYYLKHKKKPFFRKQKTGTKRPHFETIREKLPDGRIIKEKKWWDLSKCINEYFGVDSANPIRANLEFFIPLRNMIEHRYLPELDIQIFGECQALLLNFDNFIEKHFGAKHSLKIFLSFSLQTSNSPQNIIEATKSELRKKGITNIVDYIKSFRSTLKTEIFESPQYSFKAVLIQVKNHESKDALPIKFIHYDNLTEEQKQSLNAAGIVLIKDKVVKIPDTEYLADKITYDELTKLLRKKIPGFKINEKFHSIKREIITERPKLIHQRRLDPKNPSSSKKDYYSPEIVAEFEKKYSKINGNV